MKRFFTTLWIALAATTMMAQMQIWYNGAIVYERDYKMIDSVTFALPHNEGGEGEGDALSPEGTKEKLMEIAKKMVNTFQTNDQRDFIEIADACYTKYENYSWEGFEDYFESTYDPVFDDGRNYASERPNPVAPYVGMLYRVARVEEGKAAPTNINYIFSF